jgi:hypothetical protein
MAVLGSIVLVVVGRLAYGTALPHSAALVAASFLLGALAFLAIGFLIAAVAPSARAAQAIGLTLFFPMWLLSGAAPPPDVMGETMRRVSEALPLTYVVRGLQDPWLDSGDPWTELVVLAAILLAAVLLVTVQDEATTIFGVAPPHVELKRLEPLLGTWTAEDHTLDSVFGPGIPVRSVESFDWLEGGLLPGSALRHDLRRRTASARRELLVLRPDYDAFRPD